jgi:alkylation response protein AidB-like acyl-CoA dehydrogenase
VTAGPEPASFRRDLDDWLAANRSELERFRASTRTLDEQFENLRDFQRLLYDAGWIRFGWPPELGGLGGSPLLRGVLSEELAAAGYPPPFSFGMMEVLGPAVAAHARPELAGHVLPRLLAGNECWCQGFSEPDAGSDLASLRLRATRDGDSWRLSGQKVWTSWAKYADRCLVLARTGTIEDGHRGITAFMTDMDTPGVTLRPLRAMNGDEEFAEIFFDDVEVADGNRVGEVGAGWTIAMQVLVCERGAVAWQRQAWMHQRLEDLANALAPDHASDDERLGSLVADLHALRVRSRSTLVALAAGNQPGPAASVDKLLMSGAEQRLFDAALDLLPDQLLTGDGPDAETWRNDYLYSRAASIYGGTAEIQRNIVADRLLALPRSR